jgi:hypothetical protein
MNEKTLELMWEDVCKNRKAYAKMGGIDSIERDN